MPTTVAFITLSRAKCLSPKQGMDARVGIVPPTGTPQVTSRNVEFLTSDSQGWKPAVPNVVSQAESGAAPGPPADPWTRYHVDNRDENLHCDVRVTVGYAGGVPRLEKLPLLGWTVPKGARIQEIHEAQFDIRPSLSSCGHVATHPHVVAGIVLPRELKPLFWGFTLREVDGQWTGQLPGLAVNTVEPGVPLPTIPNHHIWRVGITNTDSSRRRMLAIVAVLGTMAT